MLQAAPERINGPAFEFALLPQLQDQSLRLRPRLLQFARLEPGAEPLEAERSLCHQVCILLHCDLRIDRRVVRLQLKNTCHDISTVRVQWCMYEYEYVFFS